MPNAWDLATSWLGGEVRTASDALAHAWQVLPHVRSLSDLASILPHDATQLALQALQIVWINVLLSGDNAVVIALACRSLDRRRRTWAIAGGSAVAVLLRIVLTFFVVALLGLPAVKLFSGCLLLWIAVDLLRAHESGEVEAAGSIWGAIRTIALADAVMSLDNVVAVAAAAKNSVGLIIFGIALSIPLIVFGSTLILAVLKRFPILVVAGAVLLGWVAGEIASADPLLQQFLPAILLARLDLWLKIGCAVLMLGVAGLLALLRRRTGARPTSPVLDKPTG
jgi:YjbE family integral membrane protein